MPARDGKQTTVPIREQSSPNGDGGRIQRAEKIRRSARALLRLLAEEKDAEVLRAVHEELALVRARLQVDGGMDEVEFHQSRLSPLRRRFDASDPQARAYLQALDEQGHRLEQQGKIEECLSVLGRRVEHCPTPEAQIRYGRLLQSAGRLDEAAQQYARLPHQDYRKHYNLASLSLQRDEKEEALIHLLRGLTHDPQANLRFNENFAIRMMLGQRLPSEELLPVGPAPTYWDQFGHLWTADGRSFVNRVCAQPLVRFRLRKSRQMAVKFRHLIPASSRKWLLERVESEDFKDGGDGSSQKLDCDYGSLMGEFPGRC